MPWTNPVAYFAPSWKKIKVLKCWQKGIKTTSFTNFKLTDNSLTDRKLLHSSLFCHKLGKKEKFYNVDTKSLKLHILRIKNELLIIWLTRKSCQGKPASLFFSHAGKIEKVLKHWHKVIRITSFKNIIWWRPNKKLSYTYTLAYFVSSWKKCIVIKMTSFKTQILTVR